MANCFTFWGIFVFLRVRLNQESTNNTMFMPKETLDQACDVVLIVEDGELEAHKDILSKASPFFEKLLNSDMKEAKEGVVRLEMFTESVMRNTLKFIYTGGVQILKEDDARNLVVIADFLFLENLKTFAARALLKKTEMNISNCISTLRFAERYHCGELVSKTKHFIHNNFPAIYNAKREVVLSMAHTEIANLLSSDELCVGAEEDVFNFVLTWIEFDRGNRERYFAEIFRHVRLVYISRDFLCNDVVTHDLVKSNRDCLELVNEAINMIDCKKFENLPFKPRKSLETSAIVISDKNKLMCYFPVENDWVTLGKIRCGEFGTLRDLFPCHDKLYSTKVRPTAQDSWELVTVGYNPYCNTWTSPVSTHENRYVREIFVANGDEIHALLSGPCFLSHEPLCCGRVSGTHSLCPKNKHLSYITKYKPESNSWHDIASFDYLDLRQGFCLVAQGNFIYFVSGFVLDGDQRKYLNEVDRYDFDKNQWRKLANIQVAREWASGAATSGKIVIFGGDISKYHQVSQNCQCELYDETTNEWHFIKTLKIRPGSFTKLLIIDGKIHAFCKEEKRHNGRRFDHKLIELYDSDNNTQSLITRSILSSRFRCCAQSPSVKVFRGFFNNCKKGNLSDDELAGAPSAPAGNKKKCSVL